MSRTLRILAPVAAAAAAILLVVAGGVYGFSEAQLRRAHRAPTDAALVLPTDSVALARGARLAHVLTGCADCHGGDLGGKVYADAGPLGIIVGPNLTRGRGGLGTTLTDADWVRAMRRGVRADGRSLIVMPSETFVHLGRSDLAAVIAYVKTRPPVDRELPATRFRPLGRALLVAGKLPILVADKTPDLPLGDGVAPAPTAGYGAYLADIAGCRGCHGLRLSGGAVAGPPGTPPASNLTPAGPIGSWSESQFDRALRFGLRPDGTALSTFMPWPQYVGMTPDEVHALWLYLRGVPPLATGNR